jgi:tetratricopeptide (TPR) repeat protein
LDALAAPASLQVLVASRLDMLPPAERSVLAAASVLGQTFSLGALEATSGRSEDLPQLLRELIGRDLLTTITDRLSAEDGQYAFVQAVVRTVAYQTQSRRDRLQRHLAVVEHLEASADSDSQLSTVIAQHLRDALELVGSDDPQRAELAGQLGRWLKRSADRSLAVGAPLDAVRAFEEAIALAGDGDEVISLHLAAADAALAAGAQELCVEHTLMIATGEVPAQRRELARARAAASNSLRMLGRLDEAWALLEPYLDDPLDDLAAGEGATLSRQVAVCLDSMARYDEGLLWTERALRFAEDTGDPRLISQCLSLAAVGFLVRGLHRLSIGVLEMATTIAREHGLVFDLAYPLLNQLAMRMNQDPAAALAAGNEAMTLFEQVGSIGHCWHTALNQAIVLNVAGRWDEVASLRERPLLREQPPTVTQASVLDLESALIAQARDEPIDLAGLDTLAAGAETGQLESVDDMYLVADRAMHARASRDFDTLTTACRRLVHMSNKYLGLEDDFPHLWSLAVGWMIDAEDFDGARELLRPVADVPPTRWNRLIEAQLPRLRGSIEALDPQSEVDAATIEADLSAGIAALDDFGAIPDRARGQATLGLWLIRQGRTSEAAEHLAAARATFTDLQATAWLRDLESATALAAAG